jgi:predicted pyridoxine 5'-phosphate oxidase superfamily flavin-nucleotide-binding protein
MPDFIPDEDLAASSDVGFTPTVKAIQSRKGSRAAYERMEAAGGWETEVTTELAAFVSEQRSFFLATTNSAGQPYIQHRGGPPGFLRALDGQTLAFADYNGNRQYITQGNLEDNAELIARLMPTNYKARPEQVIVFTVTAWDANCPQHIPQRFEAEDVQQALAERDAKIAELEAQIAALR